MDVLITGVSGTLGRKVTEKLLKEKNVSVIGISRDEQKQRTIPKHEKLTLRLGDIRDKDFVESLLGEFFFSKVLHFASLKCVDTLEANPQEAFKTNVIGTNNIVEAEDRPHRYCARAGALVGLT